MNRYDLKLLDCTLRDGGYINDWRWGYKRAKEVIAALVKAGVDIVEVGFLRNIEAYDPDITVCEHIDELNKLLPKNTGNTMFSAMAMRSNYDINKLAPYSGQGIEMIRITAHEYDIQEGMDFAREVKDKGYKLSINPINIMGYTDEQILWILKEVNDILPYQFSIVDTFGSMKRRDLDRIVSLVDNNLDRSIRVALHLHENMSLSCSLAQSFVDKHLNRPVSVDGSLMGIGRIPGNLPIELIADYLNDYTDKNYDLDPIMDAIQDHISPLKGDSQWGYTPAYFLSARFNLHRNYAEHYLNKGNLTNKDINHILSRFDRAKASVFDKEYADNMYNNYMNNRIDDTEARHELLSKLSNKEILLIAPGSSIITHKDNIETFIDENKPIVITVNFVQEMYKTDYVFFSNSKRFNQYDNIDCDTIVTSNIMENASHYKIDYNGLSGAFDGGCNSLIMLLKLLQDMSVGKIYIAGADGYSLDKDNYYNPSMRSYSGHDNSFNTTVADIIEKMPLDIEFLTPSLYNRE